MSLAGGRRIREWPSIEFTAPVREIITTRDARPQGSNATFCVVGGEPLAGRRMEIHHRKRKGPGDGRPSNGIPVCAGDPDCGHGKIHAHPEWARLEGFIITATVPGRYNTPLHCAVRGWIILDDYGNWAADQSGDNDDGPPWRPPLP